MLHAWSRIRMKSVWVFWKVFWPSLKMSKPSISPVSESSEVGSRDLRLACCSALDSQRPLHALERLHQQRLPLALAGHLFLHAADLVCVSTVFPIYAVRDAVSSPRDESCAEFHCCLYFPLRYRTYRFFQRLWRHTHREVPSHSGTVVAFWEVYKEGFQGVAVARGRSTVHGDKGTVDHGH